MKRTLRVGTLILLGALLGVTAFWGTGRLWANGLASDSVPELVNYQGYLADASSNPISSTVSLQFSIWDASSGGTQLWSEAHANVSVIGGYFSVMLGSQGTPLTPSVFGDTSRYLEVTYGATTFARQRFASVPYALVAEKAALATSATNAVNATYAMTATYALSAPSSGGGVAWANVVVVAKSGGDYTTVTEAMNAISPTSTDRYLVLVMPGVYEEQVTLKPYVHLKGMGTSVTFISSTANSNNVNGDDAATMLVPANAYLSDLTVRNTSASDNSTGVKVNSGNEETVFTNVRVEVKTAGGGAHRGIFINGGNSTPKFIHVDVDVSAATQQNWGVFVTASSPHIQDSKIVASGAAGDMTYGFRMNGGNPTLVNTLIRASNGSTGQGVNTSGGGTHTIQIDRSTIEGDMPGASIISTDNYKIYVGGSLIVGPVFIGGTADFICVNNYDGDYNELDANCQ